MKKKKNTVELLANSRKKIFNSDDTKGKKWGKKIPHL